MKPSGGWNVDFRKANFHSDEVNDILSIPISKNSREDTVLCHYEGNGMFSVKSGNWLGNQTNDNLSPSTSSSSNSWWLFFWKLKIPLKVKIMVWKACHDWLPTKVNIARRGIRTSNICAACKCSDETTFHALWDSKRLKNIREEWNQKKGKLKGNFSNILELLQVCMTNKSLGDAEIFCVVIWRIWFGRNLVSLGQREFCWEDVISWSELFLSDYQKADSTSQTESRYRVNFG
ncbi:hypothetical protein LWI28_026244 [Acer negundo]|uniref:Reverse transcriptase zinc-binding domain-containing protein n=1 Tax=Acer negundo TaxID=4023 RepID=A0AAD5JN43_ACENE|nr:hypothetical protein LWI28_026244 [Acer negundo]